MTFSGYRQTHLKASFHDAGMDGKQFRFHFFPEDGLRFEGPEGFEMPEIEGFDFSIEPPHVQGMHPRAENPIIERIFLMEGRQNLEQLIGSQP